MRRLLVVGLDALNLQRFHRARLALHLLFQPLEQLALLDDDAVQLLDLVFEVRDGGFKFFGAPGIIVCHAAILPARRREVEAVNEVDMAALRPCLPVQQAASGWRGFWHTEIPSPDAALGDGIGRSTANPSTKAMT